MKNKWTHFLGPLSFYDFGLRQNKKKGPILQDLEIKRIISASK